MKYKLLVLDIDGTATNSVQQVTPVTREAVIRLQQHGIPVVIASGRPTPGVAPIAEIFQFGKYGSYALSYNGARITNWKTKETIYNKTLPAHIPALAYEEACRYNLGIYTFPPDDSALICGRHSDEYIQLEARVCGVPIEMCDGDFPQRVSFRPNKCNFSGHPDTLARLEPVLAEKYGHEINVYRSEAFYLEFLPQNIDKAESLARLLDILGLSREEMVCVGDGFNDLSMIRYAGLGVAMANAKDPVKEAADYITLSNDEDGVAHVIEKFFFENESSN